MKRKDGIVTLISRVQYGAGAVKPRRSCCALGACLLVPDFESARPDHTISMGCKLVPMWTEVTVDERMSGEKVLRLFGRLPGRPEGFHLQPPTEPCVNLSIYTARPSHFLPPRDDSRRGRRVLLPISRLASTFLELGHPLRSTPITGASSLLLDDPPSSRTSVLSPFVFPTYRVFPWHCMKSSQVPYPSPDQSHATYTPDTTWPISRHPPC